MYISGKIGKWVGVILLCCGITPLFGDNLRIVSPVNCVVTAENQVDIEVQLSWSNSWRNSCNYDAVYIFGKYRLPDSDEKWHHLFFDASDDVHSVGSGYGLSVMNGGRGLLVYRSEDGQGESAVTLHLRWSLDGNASAPVSAASVSSGEVLVSLQGLEMVYVPTSPFYMGDGFSSGSYRTPTFGVLPSSSDLIGTNSNFVYTASTNSTYAVRAADRRNNAVDDGSMSHYWSSAGGNYPAWWQVDFKSDRRILYFGVSGLCWEESSPSPGGTWYLEGSPSGSSGSWVELWHGGPEDWGESRISYPVQHAIRVTSPGSYRYYRIRVDDSRRKDFWDNISIANVAMTEDDLSCFSGTGFLLQDGCSNSLPSGYADGVRGYYAMKYELTQEQYVTFLNRLPRSAQYSRTIGGLLDGVREGEYVYGPMRDRPSFRNGIIVQERRLNSRSPYLFACNLNPENVANSLDDGQTVGCNYLSPGDMLAYADWSGLRPLSELEYEKMCRVLYPELPSSPDYAWGSVSPSPGSGWQSSGTESEHASSGNVNSGGSLEGPCRVGSFVGSGVRSSSGNSFLGFSDLSGNLSEIYVNTELYGLQFRRDHSGSGVLSSSGDVSVSREYWPLEVSAYGVRGGDYSSSDSFLRVADRSRMCSFFGDLNDKFPTVGVRLGLSCEPGTMETVLSLENGLRSGATEVFDTICDGSDYVIRGSVLPVEHGHYFWFCSKDNGESWERLDGCTSADLHLRNLTSLLPRNSLEVFRYKRLTYTLHGYSESGVVGLVVSHGYESDRICDTLQPCVASHGFTLSTRLPSTYRWECLDIGKELESTALSSVSSRHELRVSDFQSSGSSWPSGLYTIGVEINVAGKCREDVRLEVLVVPYTRNPFPDKVVTYAYNGQNSYQIENTWSGPDAQRWTLTNGSLGTLEISDRGLVSNVSSTMCSHITVEAVCEDFPDKVYRMELHEPSRSYASAGAYTLNLLPGEYTFECWGASGGGSTNQNVGSHAGLGGYAGGDLEVSESQRFYLYVGGTTGSTAGGWNGGGNGSNTGFGGGGATDIRLMDGAWNDRTSLFSRIMVAGGGGGPDNPGGTFKGDDDGSGGAGGGLQGNAACIDGVVVNRSYYTASGCSGCGMGGTQTQGYAWGQGEHVTCNTDTGGGGGGYRGGYVTNHNNGGAGGGSGFVSGLEGCNAVDEGGNYTGQAVHYSGILFKNGVLKTGQRAGHGMVKITVK